jgi:serine/threonine-protein kinase
MYLRSRDHDRAPRVGSGERFGAFVLGSALAEGQLCSLRRAQAVASPEAGARKLSVQRLKTAYVNDAELRRLLLAAGQTGMKRSGPNMVRVLEVQEQPEPHVIMEHVEGLSLHDVFARPWLPGHARYLLPAVVDVLEALRALHERSHENGSPDPLLHCAPSARQIMLGYDGVGRLWDLTQAVGAELPWSPNRDGFLAASDMAPEQVLVPAHVDARCDLFIVGGVLWRALAGKGLFEAETSEEALQNVLRKPIPLPSEVGSEAGHALDRVCKRALQRSRSERFASAAEMADALRTEAERAALWASREEIGTWVRGLAAVPGSSTLVAARRSACEQHAAEAVTLRTTITGLGPVVSREVEAARGPFRPARPSVRLPAPERPAQRVAAKRMQAHEELDAAVAPQPEAASAPSEPRASTSERMDRTWPTRSAVAAVEVRGSAREQNNDASELERGERWHPSRASVAVPLRRMNLLAAAASLTITLLFAGAVLFLVRDPELEALSPAAPIVQPPQATGSGEGPSGRGSREPTQEDMLQALLRAEPPRVSQAPAPRGSTEPARVSATSRPRIRMASAAAKVRRPPVAAPAAVQAPSALRDVPLAAMQEVSTTLAAPAAAPDPLPSNPY